MQQGIYKTEEEMMRAFKTMRNIINFATGFTVEWEEMAVHWYNYAEGKRMGRTPQDFFDRLGLKYKP